VHRSILHFLRVKLKPLGTNCTPIWHTPNAPRNKIAGGKLKALGMAAGFPDLAFIANGTFYAIEVKAEGQYLRKSQKVWRDHIELAGGKFAVCKSIDDAEATLIEWGLIK
jgi:hypothetical protein